MTHKVFRSFNSLLVMFLVLAGLPARVNATYALDLGMQIEKPSPTTHYIVFEKRGKSDIVPVYYRLVELAAPLQTITDDQLTRSLAQPSRNTERMVTTLQSTGGSIVYQDIVEISPWLRGEFHGANADAPIDGHLLPVENPFFVVRVPQIAGTTLVMKNAGQAALAQFDLEKLSAETPLILFDNRQVVAEPRAAGAASNRVDLLVMGDGYTSAQAAKFNTDAASVASQLFGISPYTEYQNYFNLHTLFTASSQSGADHPSYNASCSSYDPTCCGDPAMQSDQLQGQMVNTAFDARFCANNIHRLLVTSYSKIFAAAAAVPDWDTILVMVNDTTYGGSGGSYSTISMHSAAAQVAQHELGHSFVDLADEYESAYPGYPTCSDLSGSSPCEVNVTDVITRAQIKWYPWILGTTPIPTPNNSSYNGLVGLFQGARYQSTGMYRPGYSCIMRSLGAPYCQIPSQAFVLKLYNGGWGVPADGISLIEPDTMSPSTPIINLTHPTTQVFHADILSPIGGPPAQITWLKNGIVIPGENSDTYTYTTSTAELGLNHITVRAKDVTSLVAASMAGGALQDENTWDVTVITPLTIFGKISPANVATAVPLSPTLSWQASPSAASYEYCYSSAPGPCTKWNSVGSDTSVILSGLAPNYTYYWQVREVNPGGVIEADDGIWWSFTTTDTAACTWPAYTPPATPTFSDVPVTASYWSWVERLANTGITAGCAAGIYCPLNEVNRAQMAIFLLRARHCGSSYVPPAVGASTGFSDVPLTASYAPWVKQLAAEGITTGCGGGNFCPTNLVTRAQMAIFLLRAKHGSTYSPPAVGASTGFGDVPVDASYAAWVKQLAAEGVTAGCGGGNFCPLQNVTRAQMATFLARAFGLP